MGKEGIKDKVKWFITEMMTADETETATGRDALQHTHEKKNATRCLRLFETFVLIIAFCFIVYCIMS